MDMRQLIVMMLLGSSLLATAVETFHPPKAQKMRFRIIAAADPVAKSGFSPNREIYVAELISSQNAPRYVKLVIRYLGYEDGFQATLLDSSFVHMFLAIQDRSCNESWGSLATKTVINKDRSFSEVNVLNYLNYDQPPIASEDPELLCYTSSPRSYRGSRQAKDLGMNDSRK